MRTRRLGSSALRISEIVYGTGGWLAHPTPDQADAALSCLRLAIDLGVTTFDLGEFTARPYAEELLGRVVADVPRDSLQLFTKVNTYAGEGHDARGLSGDAVRSSIDDSLRRLGTDHVEVYLLPSVEASPGLLAEVVSAAADVVRSGKARALGFADMSADGLWRVGELVEGLGIDVVAHQAQYNMMWRGTEAEVLPQCRRLGIGQLAWSPIAQGLLAGIYLPGAPVPEKLFGGAGQLTRWVQDEQLLTRVQGLRTVAADLDLTMAQLAIAWSLQHPDVSAAIVAAAVPEQVPDLVSPSGVTLDDSVLTRIDEVLGDSPTTTP